MNKIAILIDSTGDLNAELREKYGIDDYCAMHISYDGKEIPASLDWDAGVQPEELYKVLTEGRRIYTSAVTVQEYETKFTKYLDQGMDVLYISCSSGLSPFRNFAVSFSSWMRFASIPRSFSHRREALSPAIPGRFMVPGSNLSGMKSGR